MSFAQTTALEDDDVSENKVPHQTVQPLTA